MTSTAQPSRRRSPLVLPLLVASAALGLLASAIYVPSIPDMARDLSVPVGDVQNTLTVYLFVFAFGMLFLGPLSDRFGRRRVLLAGVVLCLAASLACTLAPTIGWLLFFRVPQALGACAGMVVSRAMIRDLFDREEAAQAMSAVAMGVTLAPALAPILGGQIQVALGWRANFAFVTIFAGVLVVVAWALLAETNRTPQRGGSLLGGLVKSYWTLLRSRAFLAYAGPIAGGAACFYVFVAMAPVILIDGYGVSPDHYGFYSALPPSGFITGSFVTNRLTRRIGLDRLIRIGSLVLCSASVVMATLALGGIAGPLAVALPLVLMGFGNGLMMPNAFAGTISLFPAIAGAASGLSGFLQMAGAALATLASALVSRHDPLMLAGMLMVGGLLAAVGYRVAIGPPERIPA